MQGKRNNHADLLSFVNVSSGCWLWFGIVNKKGYGKFRLSGKFVGAHRAAYELFKGEIPSGKWVLHTCDVPNCVNPEHLYTGTQSDNERDKVSRGRHHHVKKTHCPKGHPYSGHNLILEGPNKNKRKCRECKNSRGRRPK